ncbi:unnamed protein product, partial [Cyprideis torosa]
MTGNNLEVFTSSNALFEQMIHDIEEADSSCHMQFYIWQSGGRVDAVAQALCRAAKRGVTCRVLVDSIGSRSFIRSPQAEMMRSAGIKVLESLQAGLIKAFFARIDIRNHRKLVIIDGTIAYTGSQNMVDPAHFKQDEGVGRWVDIMLRIRGPVVESLAGTFCNDWFLETDTDHSKIRALKEDISRIRQIADVYPIEAKGNIAIQAVPSGPGLVPDAIHKLLITAIYSARKELIVTTPYFVPDDLLLTALKSASEKGVDVRLVLPKKNNSKLVHFASQAHFEDLMRAGVKIFLFTDGLLHAKTITIDGELTLLGSVNLDMRSFWLNFELTLLIYCHIFTEEIRNQQLTYQ